MGLTEWVGLTCDEGFKEPDRMCRRVAGKEIHRVGQELARWNWVASGVRSDRACAMRYLEFA